MAHVSARYGPRHRILGKLVYHAALPLLRAAGAAALLHAPHGRVARRTLESLRHKLDRGETAYLLGIGAGGHNAGVALVEVSRSGGIKILGNHEEERFRQVKHYMKYPSRAVGQVQAQMRELGIAPGQIHAALLSWDYPMFAAKALSTIAGELPGSLRLLHSSASPAMNLRSIRQAFAAPRRLNKRLRGGGAGGRQRERDQPLPVIGLRHHDNHAWFSYGVSPFAGSAEPTLVLVIDGTGDDASVSCYLAREGRLTLLRKNDDFWDSLGLTYGMLSSTQGGWPIMHSEGRFMGAAAWGNNDRLTNPYYSKLRDIFVFAPDGRIHLNRRLANWHRGGVLKPYTRRLSAILGEPIAPAHMWNPDAVLRVEEIEHAPITRDRVDKAAAVQLVFEDALFHILGHFLRATGSSQLVLTGGAALNCVANMRVLERFDEVWYARYVEPGRVEGEAAARGEARRLHLWVPPVPNDEGVAVGAAYGFACLAGVKPGAPGTTLQHAFYCDSPPRRAEIEAALREESEIGFEELGNVSELAQLQRVADLLALIVSNNGVVGLFQGAAETGPRALGHRSILANPANPQSLATLNSHVKFRERIRPLAPMATREAAERFFHLAPGAGDDDYNAYNYMVLTARARPEAYGAIPAVIHVDGTGRVQIVREQTDPFCHAYLRAMGRRIGAEVSVNTSLNVGAPIAQTPVHALETLKKTRAMDGLFLIAADGSTFAAWHAVDTPPKDAGRRLRVWMAEWSTAWRDELTPSAVRRQKQAGTAHQLAELPASRAHVR